MRKKLFESCSFMAASSLTGVSLCTVSDVVIGVFRCRIVVDEGRLVDVDVKVWFFLRL